MTDHIRSIATLVAEIDEEAKRMANVVHRIEILAATIIISLKRAQPGEEAQTIAEILKWVDEQYAMRPSGVPAGYMPLPGAARCQCFGEYRTADGRIWCCNQHREPMFEARRG